MKLFVEKDLENTMANDITDYLKTISIRKCITTFLNVILPASGRIYLIHTTVPTPSAKLSLINGER